jgi:hypothetical protein
MQEAFGVTTVKLYAMNYSFYPFWENDMDQSPDERPMWMDACPGIVSVSLSGDERWMERCRRTVVQVILDYWADNEDMETAVRRMCRVIWKPKQVRVSEKDHLVTKFFSVTLDGEEIAVMAIREVQAS